MAAAEIFHPGSLEDLQKAAKVRSGLPASASQRSCGTSPMPVIDFYLQAAHVSPRQGAGDGDGGSSADIWAQRLLAAGWSVRLLVKRPAVPLPARCSGCEIVTADLSVAAGVGEAVRGVDVIFHCAPMCALGHVGGLPTRQRDRRGPSARRHARENHNCRAWCISPEWMCTVFRSSPATKRRVPTAGVWLRWQQVQGEQLVAEALARKASIPFTILRPANVFGPGGQFVSRIGEALASGLMLTVDGGR